MHVAKQSERASPNARGTPNSRTAATHVRSGGSDAHWSLAARPALELRDETQEERERPNLPDIVDHAVLGLAGIASRGRQERSRSRRRWREVTISDATARQQVKDVLAILEPCMRSPWPPRARTLDNIQRFCSQLDSRHAGAVKNAAIARAFQTFGVRVGEEEVRRLSKLTGSGGEGDVTRYHNLCSALRKLLSESEGESQDTKMSGTPHPHSSSSSSPASSSATRRKAWLLSPLSDAGTAKTASGGEKAESSGRSGWPAWHSHRSWSPPGRGEHSHRSWSPPRRGGPSHRSWSPPRRGGPSHRSWSPPGRGGPSHSVDSSEQQEHTTAGAGGKSHYEGGAELLQAIGFECLKRALQCCSSDEGGLSVAPFSPLHLIPFPPLLHFLLPPPRSHSK